MRNVQSSSTLRSVNSSSLLTDSSAPDSPLSLQRARLRKPRPRSFKGSEKRRLLESLDSICELCNEVLKNKPDNKAAEISNFKASCSSLAEQISDDRLIETKSIEDLTNSLALFDDGKIRVNQSILGELDQLIGDFLELSGKQYIVTSTLTVRNHAVDIQETEALEPVNRSTFDPVFMTIPEPTEYAGEGLFFCIVYVDSTASDILIKIT